MQLDMYSKLPERIHPFDIAVLIESAHIFLQAVTPGFASPVAPGHNLSARTAASAMVDAGHPTPSAPRDLYGVLRSAPPDAGEHEFGVEATLFANGFEQEN